MAMAVAVILSITAAAVVNLTWRRFELSASRTDRDIALAAAETGLQYAFARLDADEDLRDAITARGKDADSKNDVYVITCDKDIPRDELIPALHVSANINNEGGKHVTVRIRFVSAPPDPTRPFRVSASADYGAEGS